MVYKKNLNWIKIPGNFFYLIAYLRMVVYTLPVRETDVTASSHGKLTGKKRVRTSRNESRNFLRNNIRSAALFVFFSVFPSFSKDLQWRKQVAWAITRG